MKELKFLFFCTVSVFPLLIIRCSLPADIEPVEWKMHIEIPIIDQHLTINDVISDSSLAGLTIDFGDTAAAGDTISVCKNDSLQYVIEKQLGTIDTSVTDELFGAQALKNTPGSEPERRYMRS